MAIDKLTLFRETSIRNSGVDAFRLFGALCVVLLHLPYGNLKNEAVLGILMLCRWAVPFFYLVSGYFFYKNYLRKGDNAFIKTIIDLTAIFLVANIINLPLAIYKKGWTLSNLFDVRMFLFGTYGHLWFIGSLIIGYLQIFFLLKARLHKWMLPIALFMIMLSLILKAYSNLFGIRSDQDFAMMLLSLPFMIFGYLISKNNFRFKSVPFVLFISLGLFGLLLQVFETYTLFKFSDFSPHNNQFLFGTTFFALGAFGVSIKARGPIVDKFGMLGAKFSLPIYLYHQIINTLLYVIFFDNMTGLSQGTIVFFIITTLVANVIIFVLIDKYFPIQFRFLNGNFLSRTIRNYPHNK